LQRRAPSIAVLIGTRPEAVKLAPVIRALHAVGHAPEVYSTGQHDELLRPTLRDLGIKPVVNLSLMKAGQSLGRLSGQVVEGVQALLRKRRPSLLIVQGDTTSVAMSSLAAFYEDIPVAHVEAGLRSGIPRNPFPEDMNRRLVACLAARHFAPTERARTNLLSEGVPAERVHVVGNTVVDALLFARSHLLGRLPKDALAKQAGEKRILVTAHRRESFGPDMEALFEGLRRAATELKNVRVVLPVHANPNVRRAARARLAKVKNVSLLKPLPYLQFVRLLTSADIVVTDSGGVLEEATALGIPVLIVRRATERGEAVDAGVAELVPPEAETVFRRIRALLTDAALYRARARASTVFGDGRAAERIVEILLKNEL
jgi:UDP-N-acetylglucosamine 2-epimerase (non-hydrolysing)